MRALTKNLFLLPVLIGGLGLIAAGRVTAQTFTVLHSFTALSGNTNSDGAMPAAGLMLSGNTLYGTAGGGGSGGSGMVFKINTAGTGLTTLHSFTATPPYPGPYTNSDGANPKAALVLSSNTLYGTASNGGTSRYGTVFKVNTDGTGFTNLHSFTDGDDGGDPEAGLILSGNTLYGTAREGGSGGHGGTVFAINTDGSGFTVLHSFTEYSSPGAGLILSDNTLYGTAQGGGSGGVGTVFAVNTDGTGFRTLHNFSGGDGHDPVAELVLSGNTLYGTTYGVFGTLNNGGTVFAVDTDGTGFRTLHTFTPTTGLPYLGFPYNTNSDGANPATGLILSGNTLYGTTYYGSSSGNGEVFKVTTNGSGFAILHGFTATSACCPATNSDGANPWRGLILSGNTLYGTAVGGGSSGNGTAFSLSLGSASAPQLTLSSDGSSGYFIRAQGDPNFICRLQRATSVTGPWSSIATNTALDSGLIEFHDTNPPVGRAFYRTVQQ